MESFFETLEQDEVNLWKYEAFQEVVARLPYFLEEVYNQERLRSAPGLLPPTEFDKVMLSEENNGMADQPIPILPGQSW